MALQLKYDSSLSGTKAISVSDKAFLQTNIVDNATVYFVSKGDYVILTGYGYYDGQYTNYYQTTSGLYLTVDTYKQTDTYWNFIQYTENVGQYSISAAQKQVDKIIKNNKIIIERNLLCTRFANKLTTSQKQTLYNLQKRLEQRNSALQTDGLCKDLTTSYPKGYADLSSYLNSFMTNYAGAVGSVTATIIITAVVVSAAAYFAYKYYADESEEDVKYSAELTKVLTSKLTEEEYQQLLKETNGLVTKAKIKQSLLGISKYWIVGAIALAGGTILIRKFLK